MRLVRLKMFNGTPIAVNAEAIAYLQPSGDQTTLAFLGGSTLIVGHSFEALVELLADDAP